MQVDDDDVWGDEGDGSQAIAAQEWNKMSQQYTDVRARANGTLHGLAELISELARRLATGKASQQARTRLCSRASMRASHLQPCMHSK